MKNRYCIITDRNGRVMTFNEEGQIAYPASDAYWHPIRITTMKNAKKVIKRSTKLRKSWACSKTRYNIKPIEFDHDIVVKKL